MPEKEIIGLIIIAVGTILGVAIPIVAPLIKLNTNLSTLNEKLGNILKSDEIRDFRLKKHGEMLDEHEKVLENHKVRLEHMEEEVKRI